MDTINTMRHSTAANPSQARRSSDGRGFVSRLVWVVNFLAKRIDHFLERRRSRLALLEMTDDQLKDIGVSRCDAHREGIRPIWE